MKVRLGFAVAAQMEPDVLIIDEVLAVGDIGFRFKCLNAIGDLMKNSAVIFVSHAMPQIYRICTEVMLLNHGKCTFHSNEIGKGIEMYYDMFSNGEQQVAGSGEVQVESFELLCNDSHAKMGESIIVEHGADLNIQMKLHMEMHIPEAMVQIVVWNQEMLPVLDILSMGFKGHIINQNSTGYHSISLVIPNILLNAGKHTMSVIVNSPDASHNYCRHDNAGAFNMTANFPSGAHMLMPLTWEAK